MPHRIEICGGIAAGKTSLALVLAQQYNEIPARAILEDFDNIPFWKSHQRNIDYEFAKNISFILSHFELIAAADPDCLSICDFAMIEDLAYADLSEPRDASLIEMVYDRVRSLLPPPALIIRLSCAPDTRLRRIHRRGRTQELEISRTYLEGLITAIDARLMEVRERNAVPVLEIDSDAMDYVNRPEVSLRIHRDIVTVLFSADAAVQPPSG